MSDATLTTVEHATLMACEEVIRRGLQTFVEVGKALATIRFQRLYRLQYADFDDYCMQRWSMLSSRARQLIAAAEVVEDLQTVTMVTIMPSNERQARPLVPLPSIQRAEVWKEVVKTGKPTAERVIKKVKEMEISAPIPRLERLAAKHRVLTTAIALLEEDIGARLPDVRGVIYPDDAAEEAAYAILESSVIERHAHQLVVSLSKKSPLEDWLR